MLPAGEDVVVVEIIYAADVVAAPLAVVVVQRATLVLGVDVFQHYGIEPVVGLVVVFYSEKPVFQAVEEIASALACVPILALPVAVVIEHEHRRMVFKVFVGIHAEAPPVAVVVHACHPAAQLVAGLVLIDGAFLYYVGTSGYECAYEIFEPLPVFNLLHTVGTGLIRCSAERAGHLQTQFDRPGREYRGVANLEEARLAVVEHLVGILRLSVGEAVLPVVVGHATVCYVAFQV